MLKQILIDADTGIDDSIAILFALKRPDVRVMGVTTGFGNTTARQAAEKGHAVIYGPAQVLLHQLEKEHFGRAEGNSEDMLLACDLLVLDDLGAEFASPFYVSCLYNLINTRMLEGRTIILSTNLNQNQLKERYGDPITSRITGTFVPLLFMGRDIRQQKRQEKL